MPKALESASPDSTGLQPVPVVAKFLALSRSKVYQLMDQGRLPYVKIGKSRRIRWPDVLQFVEQNTVEGA